MPPQPLQPPRLNRRDCAAPTTTTTTTTTAIFLILLLLLLQSITAAPSTTTTATTPPIPHLFFLDSSADAHAPSFNFRCSVESAVRHNPGHDVRVYSNGLDPEAWHNVSTRITVEPFDPIQWMHEAAARDESGVLREVQQWYRDRAFETGYPFNNLANAMRLVLLYGRGGTYLDTDVLSVKPLSSLEGHNIVAWQNNLHDLADSGENERKINVAELVSFVPESSLIRECLSRFVREFDGAKWGWQGPDLITRVLRGLNHDEHDVDIRSKDTLNPLGWHEVSRLFDDVSSESGSSLLRRIQTHTTLVHLWNSQMKGQMPYAGSSSVLVRLYEEACPVSFREHFASVAGAAVEEREEEDTGGVRESSNDDLVLLDNQVLRHTRLHVVHPKPGQQLLSSTLYSTLYQIKVEVEAEDLRRALPPSNDRGAGEDLARATLARALVCLKVQRHMQICRPLIMFEARPNGESATSFGSVLPAGSHVVFTWLQLVHKDGTFGARTRRSVATYIIVDFHSGQQSIQERRYRVLRESVRELMVGGARESEMSPCQRNALWSLWGTTQEEEGRVIVRSEETGKFFSLRVEGLDVFALSFRFSRAEGFGAPSREALLDLLMQERGDVVTCSSIDSAPMTKTTIVQLQERGGVVSYSSSDSAPTTKTTTVQLHGCHPIYHMEQYFPLTWLVVASNSEKEANSPPDTHWFCNPLPSTIGSFSFVTHPRDIGGGVSVNAYPNVWSATNNKTTFCLLLRETFPNTLHEFFMPCFALRLKLHREELLGTIKDARAVGSTFTFFVKPSEGSGGKGIRFASTSSLEARLLEPDEETMGIEYVQFYLQDPMLLRCTNRRKFDLRVYALVTSWNPPTFWLHQDGFARISTATYVSPSGEPDDDLTPHITNVHYQRDKPGYALPADAEDDCSKDTRSLRCMLEAIEEERDVPVWNTTKRLRRAVGNSLLAAKNPLNSPECTGCYQIFGFDVLVRDDGSTYVVEMNSSPSIETNNPVADGNVLRSVFLDAWKIKMSPNKRWGVEERKILVRWASWEPSLGLVLGKSKEERALLDLVAEWCRRGKFDLALPGPLDAPEIVRVIGVANLARMRTFLGVVRNVPITMLCVWRGAQGT